MSLDAASHNTMADWNPPPPEQEEPGTASKAVPDEDRIGDTVFSKAWVLSLLVEAVRAVESTSESQPEHKVGVVSAVFLTVLLAMALLPLKNYV